MANQDLQQGNARSGRGFAGMDSERQREIASRGGRAAHQAGTAHEFDSEEARAAGRKGGEAVSQNRQHMAAIGSKGGQARAQNRNAANQANREQQQQRAGYPSADDFSRNGAAENDPSIDDNRRH